MTILLIYLAIGSLVATVSMVLGRRAIEEMAAKIGATNDFAHSAMFFCSMLTWPIVVLGLIKFILTIRIRSKTERDDHGPNDSN